MRRVVIDTDVASLSIKQRLPPALSGQLVGAQVGITFVTLGELTRWATMRQWGPARPDVPLPMNGDYPGARRRASTASGAKTSSTTSPATPASSAASPSRLVTTLRFRVARGSVRW